MHTQIRQTQRWGTYIKNPTKQDNDIFQWVLIKDLSDTHIYAILRTQWQITQKLRHTLHEEIIYRTMNDIHIADVERYYQPPTFKQYIIAAKQFITTIIGRIYNG